MLEIKDEDIVEEENKLSISFDEARKTVIKELESCDVVACAGSGKTTLMCAKIDILTKKQPFKNNKGIAVVSLTNVAIEQIKIKLGYNHKIFNYPNYCETIQKFASRYILKNWLNQKYNIKIKSVDENISERKLLSKLNSKIKKYIENSNFNIGEIYTDGEKIYKNNEELTKIPKLKEKNDEYIKAIKSAKMKLISEGIFNYRDVLEISTKYLKDNPTIKNFIKNRFEICFVDEMQDCRYWEKNFLEEVFEYITFQKFGDPNQRIYEDTEWIINNPIIINNSLRNSINIANFAKIFEEKKTNMVGNAENDIKVKFIIYKKDNILDVKKQFIKEIKRENLNKNKNNIFKIIGKVEKASSSGKIELVDYVNDLKKENNLYLDRMIDYFYLINKKNIYKTIIDVGYNVYKEIDFNNYSKIANQESFVERVKETIIKERIYKEVIKTNNIKEYIKNKVKEIATSVIIDKKYAEIGFKIISQKMEIFGKVSNYLNEDMNIEVSTIASSKGETHTATLVCESFYYEYDIENVFENHIKNIKDGKRTIDFLHSLYVAFTRPTDMLCVAITEETYEKYKNEIQSMDVELINI